MKKRSRKLKSDRLQDTGPDEEQSSIKPVVFTVKQFVSTSDGNTPEMRHVELVYVVHPQDMWQALKDRRHRVIDYDGETYHLQDTVVLSDESHPRPQMRFARILEIRTLEEQPMPQELDAGSALQPDNRYLAGGFIRVYYLSPPSEIDGFEKFTTRDTGSERVITQAERSRELVATNEMAIVDITALRGKADIRRIEVAEQGIPDGLWWQYKWDVMRKALS